MSQLSATRLPVTAAVLSLSLSPVNITIRASANEFSTFCLSVIVAVFGRGTQ